MIQAWQNFLQDANVGMDSVSEPEALLQQICLADLSHYSLLKIKGSDAATFLNGQLTCNVLSITSTHSGWGAYCDRKGRMMTFFRIFQWQGDFYLRLPQAMLPAVQQELKKYVLFSKVELQDASAEWVRIALIGKGCGSLLQTVLGSTSLQPHHVLSLDQGWLICQAVDCYEIYGSAAWCQTVWKACQSQAVPVDANVWCLHQITTGIPEIFPETQGLFLPHYLNLPELGAVDFKKGCYRGQEIVARMEYRGQIKRGMRHLVLRSQSGILPGTLCFEKETEVGKVIWSAKASSHSTHLLCELPLNQNLDTVSIQCKMNP